MKEQIIKIIESKAQGKYHLEIDESDLEVIANEILNLFSVSQQRELLKGFANRFNESSETYILEGEINKFLKTFNCG
tara:strand:+ start:121 stop:351 length:231 start_codon:yes stop_codon:yes gene_type:complete